MHVLSLPYHLTVTKHFHRLSKFLTDLSFLQIKVSNLGPQPLIADYDHLFHCRYEDLRDIEGFDLHAIKIIRDALKLSSPALRTDPQQLPSQLMGRLLDHKEPGIKGIMKQCRGAFRKKTWLHPASRSLSPPDDRIIRVFTGHSDGVEHVIVSRDGEIALSSDAAGNVKTWKPSSCELLWSGNRERSFEFAADQKKVICASYTNIVKTMDIKTGEVVREIEHGFDGVNAIAVTPDESMLILACKDGILRLVDLHSGKTIRCLNGHKDEVVCVAISSDGGRILSGSAGENHLLKLWDLDSGRELNDLNGHMYRVSSVAFAENGRYGVSGSWDNNVIIWDLDSGEKLHLLKGHKNFITSVAVAANSKILSGSWDKKIKVWDLVTGKELFALEGHSDWVNSLAITGDGKHVLSASSDQTVRIWALE